MIPGFPGVAIVGSKNVYALRGRSSIVFSTNYQAGFSSDFSDDFAMSAGARLRLKRRMRGRATLRMTGSAVWGGYYRMTGRASLTLSGAGTMRGKWSASGNAALSLTASGRMALPMRGRAALVLTASAARPRVNHSLKGIVQLVITGTGRATGIASMRGKATLTLSGVGYLASDFSDDFSTDFG